MTDDDFETKLRDQNDRIREQLAALEAGPPKRLRSFTSLEVVCSDCGEPLFSVVETRPYRALRYRPPRHFEHSPEIYTRSPELSPAEQARGLYAARKAGQPNDPIRRGERSFIPIGPTESAGDLRTKLRSMCGCSSVTWSLSRIYAALENGTRKLTVSPSRR